jgi:hypothetical protein
MDWLVVFDKLLPSVLRWRSRCTILIMAGADGGLDDLGDRSVDIVQRGGVSGAVIRQVCRMC